MKNIEKKDIVKKFQKVHFNTLEADLDRLRQSVSNYEDEAIEKRLQIMRQKLRTENSKTYADMALNYLNSVNVTVRYDQLIKAMSINK